MPVAPPPALPFDDSSEMQALLLSLPSAPAAAPLPQLLASEPELVQGLFFAF